MQVFECQRPKLTFTDPVPVVHPNPTQPTDKLLWPLMLSLAWKRENGEPKAEKPFRLFRISDFQTFQLYGIGMG